MMEYKKSSAVLVFNDQGELALQLRAANDELFPSYWDFSAGGGIDSGEDGKISAERELREELGIEAKVEFVAQEQFIYPAWKSGVTRETDLFIYEANYNGSFRPNPAEVEKVEFFKLEKIKEMIDGGIKFHPEFLLSWEKGIISRATVEQHS